MAVLPVLIYPDQRLKTACSSVENIAEIQAVVQDLIDTMDAGPPRTVGIAAPQVGALVRVVIVHSDRNPRYPPGNGFLTMINPVIVEQCGEQIFREGCLSIPDYTANIRRAADIIVSYLDIEGRPSTVKSSGFESVVLQHEIDHIDGILFLDRVTDIKTDLFRRQQK